MPLFRFRDAPPQRSLGPWLSVNVPSICSFSKTNQHASSALEFDPDRFIDERLHKYLTPNPFIFLPFNGGPRICLGQQVCPGSFFHASAYLRRLLQCSSHTTKRHSCWFACYNVSLQLLWCRTRIQSPSLLLVGPGQRDQTGKIGSG